MKTIELQIPEGKKAEWINGVLTLVDDRPVTKRVRTFQDACRELGEDHLLMKEYNLVQSASDGVELSKDLQAYLKLRIICAVLNEGWEPQFTKEEYRYYPWFCFYTKKEIDDMSDADRESLFRLPSITDYVGMSFVDVLYDSLNACTINCSQLAFKTRELAIYAGRQFIGIWMDYIYK